MADTERFGWVAFVVMGVRR